MNGRSDSFSSKLRALLKNMGWMTISNFASKVLVFFMVPFYTHYLTTESYGFYDLGYSAVILLAPLVTGNAGEALMRYALVDKNRINDFFSTAFVASTAVSGLVFFTCLAIGFLFDVDASYLAIGYLLIADIFYILFSQFARGVNHVREMALGGLLNSILLVVLSYLFVVVMHMGMFGCTLATSTSLLLAALFLAVSCASWHYLSAPKLECLSQLVRYGVPLSINTLGWWVNSSFSRYAVAALMSISSSGILAAAYKIPSIPKAIQQIFVQAWQISAIQGYNKEDVDGFFGRTYDVISCLSCLLSSWVIAFIPAIAKVMFSDAFYDAWVFVPLLMICLTFDCLGSVVGGVFSAVGNTRPIALSAGASVVLAVVVSLGLIPSAGLWGAVAASITSSIIIWLSRMYWVRPYIHMKIDMKSFTINITALVAQASCASFIPISPIWIAIQICCMCTIICNCLHTVDATTLLRNIGK